MGFPLKKISTSLGMRIIKKDDILEHLEEYQKAISYFRWYPDKLVDLFVKSSGPDCVFHMYPFQRIMLRGLARHTDVYYTFSRGTSKSFINVLWNIVKCIVYPGTQAAICASTKGQSADILWSKIDEIFSLIPSLEFEIVKKTKAKDDVIIIFKNGSSIVNVAAKESTRGQRKNTLTTEEIISCDPNSLDKVVRPLLAISRLAANGKRNPQEIQNRTEAIITTAGVKSTYSYERLIYTLTKMLTQPGKALVLGGSYKVPIIAGLQDMSWIRDMKLSGDFNPTSFPREFLSQWASGSEQAFFPGDTFDKLRALKEPEFEGTKKASDNFEYIFGVDIGRFSDTSEITIIKRLPQVGTASTKHIVNIVTLDNIGFPEQAVKIKQLYERFKPKQVVIDGAGIGAGLIDELVMSQVDPETGMYLRPWGVSNDEDGRYTRYRAADTIKNILYIIKANAPFNTQMYSNLQQQFLTNKIRFLGEEREARARIEASRAKKFQEMTQDDKINYLLPFYQTSDLKAQMINLESTNEGLNIIMKRSNGKILKDKVSSLGYGLYYIKVEMDDKEMSRRTLSIAQALAQGLNTKRGTSSKRNLTFNGDRKYKSKLNKKGR